MPQSRRMSLIRAISNVVLAYVLALATQIVVFPWFGLHLPFVEKLVIGAIFVVSSLLRKCTLHRMFEQLS